MKTNKLYELAEENDISVSGFPLPENKAITIMLNDKCYVAIDPSVLCSPLEEKVCLAHELGHCQTGAFYNQDANQTDRERQEKKAERWAIERLVPLNDLKKAIKNGRDDLVSLSEHFDVPVKFMYKALLYYNQKEEIS